MKLWWGTSDSCGIVVAANNLQEAVSCIQETKYFEQAKINPNFIGSINIATKKAYVICNSNPVIHDDDYNDYDDEVDEDYDDDSNYDDEFNADWKERPR